jgi:putative redox protein
MILQLKRINQQVGFEITNEGGNTTRVDGSEQVGGEGLGMRPMELLAGALVSCVSIDVLHILKKKRIELKHFEVAVEARRKTTLPAAFEQIHLIFYIASSDPLEQVKKTIQLSLDAYCSVAASLSSQINITFEIQTIPVSNHA